MKPLIKLICSSFILLTLSACSYLTYNTTGFSAPSKFEQQKPLVDDVLQVVMGERKSPFPSVCHIQVNRRHLILGKNYPSSASIVDIGNHKLLFTANHSARTVWYSKPKSLWFECGIGTEENQTPLYSQKISSVPTVFSPKISDFDDFAAVLIPNAQKVPESDFVLATEDDLQAVSVGDAIYISGYPGKISGNRLTLLKTTISCPKRNQNCGTGTLQMSLGNKIYYSSTDTGKGMSGGPIWKLKPNGEKVIIGVHGFGHEEQKTQSGGFMLDKTTLGQLNSWLEDK